MDLQKELWKKQPSVKEPRLASLIAAQVDMLEDFRDYKAALREMPHISFRTTVDDDGVEGMDFRCDVRCAMCDVS